MYEQTAVTLSEIFAYGRAFLKPHENILVSEWAEKCRIISEDESKGRPGLWDNTVAPYAVEIMDAFIEPDVYKLTMIGSAQISKTEIIKNIIGYIIENVPAPILLIYPTEDAARSFSSDKLEPMFRVNEGLNSKIAKHNSRNKDNKTLYKKFVGGSLSMVGSNSPTSLAQRSIKYVLVDDRDRVTTAGDEGDAVELAEQRTESYSMLGAKIAEFSTPTIKGISKIEASYLASDQRQYHVPCPECKYFQTIQFENLVWEKEKDVFGYTVKHYPETVKFACKKCGSLIDEKHKYNMMLNGKWIASNPDIIHHRGYMINRLYSPFSTWGKHVAKFLEVKNDPTKLQVFYNTTLAKTWEIEESSEIDVTGLTARCEDYLTEDNPFVPENILLLTGSVDTQPDRLEVHVWGWAANEEPYALAYKKFYGDADQDEVWEEVDDYFTDYKVTREDGRELSISYVPRLHHPIFVDSGGSNTQAVLNQCKRRYHKGFLAIKGVWGYDKPILLNRSKGGPKRNTPFQNIGVDGAKTILMKLLSTDKSPQKIHFTKAFCDIDYFAQITSEKAVKTYDRKNGAQIIWKKKKRNARNEVTDLFVYGYAAMKALNPNWKKLQDNLSAKTSEEKQQTIKPEPAEKLKRVSRKKRSGYSVHDW